MVNFLVCTLFVTVFSVDYAVHQKNWLPGYMILLPELLSCIVLVIVFVRMIAGVRVVSDRRYLLFLALLATTLLTGFTAQHVPSGAVVAGIRDHLKFLPLFFLPAVYRFTPAQLKAQFVLLMCLFLLQLPLALYQRFIEFAGAMYTGDPVRGTATTSSALSLVLICGIAAVIVLYLRRKLRLSVLIGLISILFLPTTLNETKATFLLLPVALLVPPLFMPRGSKSIRRLLPIAALGALGLFTYVGIYNYLIQYRQYGQSIGQFFGHGGFEQYLYTGAAAGGAEHIGRFDSVQMAIEGIDKDPMTYAFGLGAGNVSTSFLPQFNGEHADYYQRYGVGMTEVTDLLWQVGVVGLFTYLLFYYFVYRDARFLARGDDHIAILGQIWVAVMAVMTFALIYKSVLSMNEIGYPFWFYSGVVASHAVAQRRARRSRAGQSLSQRPSAAGGAELHGRGALDWGL